jgi:hypothetical protein
MKTIVFKGNNSWTHDIEIKKIKGKGIEITTSTYFTTETHDNIVYKNK